MKVAEKKNIVLGVVHHLLVGGVQETPPNRTALEQVKGGSIIIIRLALLTKVLTKSGSIKRCELLTHKLLSKVYCSTIADKVSYYSKGLI